MITAGAIYTPQGLKIRFPLSYAFGLMARVLPEVHPYAILKTTEGLDCLGNALAFITALALFLLRATPWVIVLGAGLAQLLGFSINNRGFFFVPGLPALGTCIATYKGEGLILVVQVTLGAVMVGWIGVAAFYLGTMGASALGWLIELRQARVLLREAGRPITSSERSFLNAYRLHASGLGRSTDLELGEGELLEENWLDVFAAYLTRCPRAAAQSASA